MAMPTLKTTPLYSLHSIIITIVLFGLLQCPCLCTSAERSSRRSFLLSNLGNGLQLSSKSFNSLVNNTIRVAQEAKLHFALQMASENSLHASSMAINDCVNLLDDSIGHLYLISRSTQNQDQAQGMDNSGPPCSQNTNTCSSMSAILANQEMCMEGLDQNFVDINNEMENETFQAAINQLNPLLSRFISTIIKAKNNVNSSAQSNSFISVPQNEHSWLGQSVDINNKLISKTSEHLSASNKVTVALDGSGDYTSIASAIEAAPKNNNRKFIIYVKRGVYHEYIEIPKSKRNLVMIGEGIGATVITGSRSKADGIKPFRTATFDVAGCGFMAQDITFENTAGPSRDQAVALLSRANNLVFYRCAFKGYQDTLYAKSGLQFFRECIIYGTVDFICGDATAVFQKCQIIARKPNPSQYNTVTAQSRILECSATGYSFHQCTFTADFDLSTSTTRTYLGRPWKSLYSRVAVMKSYLGPLIDKLGWTPWNISGMGLSKLYYGEYMNIGAGSDVKGRVTWPGFHPHMSFSEANKFTVRNFIYGDKWLPSTGVPYDLDL